MSKYRRSVVYPSISKCNAKRCSCCKHLCCKSTIKSNVNGRQFSAITNYDLLSYVSYVCWSSENQLMLFMFYLEKRKIVACNMLARLVDF